MTTNPLVSIIIPVYNMEKYLEDCIDSVIRQTFSNLEIIVINDGSSDNSRTIAERFAREDSRVIVINKPNGGVSSARNVGIGASKGDYIALVDADDMVHSKYISTVINGLVSTNADIVTSGVAMSSMSPEIFLNKEIENGDLFIEYEPEEALIALYNGTLEQGQNGCQVFKSSLIKNNKILFNESMSIGEDFDFFAQSILKSNKIVVDHRDMYFYRRNDESAVHKPFNIKQYDAIYNVQKLGRSVEKDIPQLSRVLDNNLLVNSISYGALMYSTRSKYPKEFNKIKQTIRRKKIKALMSNDLKLKSRIKIMIVTIFGTHIGFKIVNKLIKL